MACSRIASLMLSWTFASEKAFRCGLLGERCICVSSQKLKENGVILYYLLDESHNIERTCNGNIQNKICAWMEVRIIVLILSVLFDF